MQRGLAPILIIVGIVLLLIGGLGGYILSTKPQGPVYMSPLPAPTPDATSTATTSANIDDTADWKPYSNNNIGYTFKYPDNLTLEEENVIRLRLRGPTQKAESEFYDGILLQFSLPYLNEIPLKQEVQQDVDEKKNNKPDEITVEGPYEIRVADYHGYGYDERGYGTSRTYFIRSPKGHTVKITDGTVDPTNQGFKKIADQILASFKFTD